jgi:post-segregation antitoxin (ccd killing protein)
MGRRRVLEDRITVTVVLERGLYEKAARLARQRGLSFSALVRMLLEKEVAEHKAATSEGAEAAGGA